MVKTQGEIAELIVKTPTPIPEADSIVASVLDIATLIEQKTAAPLALSLLHLANLG